MPQHKVLVVDDDQPILRLMRTVLQEFGFAALTASSGAEALEIAHRENPELIVVDLNMPVMPGQEVVSKLRKTAGFAKVPILVLSGEPISGHAVAAIGADAAAQKPFDLQEFIAIVRRLLDGSASRV